MTTAKGISGFDLKHTCIKSWVGTRLISSCVVRSLGVVDDNDISADQEEAQEGPRFGSLP